MNEELLALYQADRYEHANQPKFNTPEYRAMRTRGRERRQRVIELQQFKDNAPDWLKKNRSRDGIRNKAGLQTDFASRSDLAGPGVIWLNQYRCLKRKL